MWVGDCSVLVEPSPKFQLYEYGPEPPDTLTVNLTSSGAMPSLWSRESSEGLAVVACAVRVSHETERSFGQRNGRNEPYGSYWRPRGCDEGRRSPDPE